MAVKTNTADRVLDVFRDIPTATAREIMDATGLSRTTINDNLRKLADSGSVVRFDHDGVAEWTLTPARKAANKRAARKVEKAAAAAKAAKAEKAAPEQFGVLDLATGRITQTKSRPRRAVANGGRRAAEVRERAADNADTAEAARLGAETHTLPQRTETGRRRKGEIDNEITSYFASSGNVPEGSYKVAQAIGARSGAVYVALIRMEREGTVVKTQSDPDRYALPS